MKRKYLMPVVVLVVAFAAVLSLKDLILIEAAPKAVLSSAIADTFSKLESRFGQDPVWILLNGASSKGRYRVQAALDAGSSHYDLTLHWDSLNHQLCGQGKLPTDTGGTALSFYLDGQVISVSAPEISDGMYYAIAYDSFREDLMSLPMMNFLISDPLLSQWEQALRSLQKTVTQNRPYLCLPDVTQWNWRELSLGILALPCEKEMRSLVLDETEVTCHVLSYQAAGSQLKPLFPEWNLADTASVEVSFYLYDRTLVCLVLNWEEEGRREQYRLQLGNRPEANDLTLISSGRVNDFRLRISTDQNELQTTQTLQLETAQKTVQYAYQWNPGTHQLTLWPRMEEAPICLNLYPQADGFRLESQKPIQILPLAELAVSGWLEAAPGTSVPVPEYKIIRDWSLEEFWLLFEQLSPLLGIDIGI